MKRRALLGILAGLPAAAIAAPPRAKSAAAEPTRAANPDEVPDWFQISFQMAPDSHNPFFRKAPALATEDFSQNLDFFKLRGSQLVDALREAISSPRLKRRWLATSSFGQDSVWITADATPEEIAERKEAARRRHWIMRDRPKIPVFNDD